MHEQPRSYRAELKDVLAGSDIQQSAVESLRASAFGRLVVIQGLLAISWDITRRNILGKLAGRRAYGYEEAGF
jgi:hypothetical protein